MATRWGVHKDTLDFQDEVPHALLCAKGDNEDIRDQGHHAFSCSRQRPPAADPVLSGTGTTLSERATEGKQRRSSIKADGAHTGEHSILPVVNAS